MEANMIRRSIALTLLAIGLGATNSSQASAVPGPSYCYECEFGNYPSAPLCMDCWHPRASGHLSCIPYCNGTCSVGGPCGEAFASLEVNSDGTVFDGGFGELALAEAGSARAASLVESWGEGESYAVRNCLGMIAARFYDHETLAVIESATHQLTI